MIGNRYRHFRDGSIYEIIAVSNAEWNYGDVQAEWTLITYRSLHTGTCWSRFASDFFGEVELEDGTTVRRFEKEKI